MRRKTRDLVIMVLFWILFVLCGSAAVASWGGGVMRDIVRNVACAVVFFVGGIIWAVVVAHD